MVIMGITVSVVLRGFNDNVFCHFKDAGGLDVWFEAPPCDESRETANPLHVAVRLHLMDGAARTRVSLHFKIPQTQRAEDIKT